MKVIFVGTVIPADVFQELSSVSPSTNNVQLNYIKFLYERFEGKLEVVSCYFGIRKFNQKNSHVESTDFWVEGKIHVRCVGFNDRRIFLNASAIKNTVKEIRNLMDEEEVLFIVNNHFYAQALPVYLTRRKKDICITILNEAFDVRYLPSHKNVHFRDYIANMINKYLLNKNDGLITFCEGTVKDYTRNIPYVELIHSFNAIESNEDFVNKKHMNEKRIVFYGGLIDSCYGIKEIIDSFRYLPNNYELVICGGGDSSLIDYIKKVSVYDARIHFLGMLTREQVILLEKEASVLLLIRNAKSPSEQYLARYSPPSKVTEYLAARTPVLATDIDCIPKVLKQYMNFTSVEPKEIAQRIIDITSVGSQEANEKAKNGAEYVSKFCNLSNQKTGFLEFIESTCKAKRIRYE